jgi:hypothetical protein
MPKFACFFRRRLLSAIASVVFSIAIVGCQAGGGPSEQRACTMGRLDQVPDLAALFQGPAAGCVIITWDTEMAGAGPNADGGLGTPGTLLTAARKTGFGAPCETVVDAQRDSPDRAWFIETFGEMNPKASNWGATFLARTPLPDGVYPGCSAVVRNS